MNWARMISIAGAGRPSPSSMMWPRILDIICSISLFNVGVQRSKKVLKYKEIRFVEEFPRSLMMTIHFVVSKILRRWIALEKYASSVDSILLNCFTNNSNASYCQYTHTLK